MGANISSHMNPDVVSLNLAAREVGLAGWEEGAGMSMAFLLKNNIMRRASKSTPIKPAVQAATLAFPSTTDTLKKKISYKEPLPLSDYFASVDDHHATRVALRIAESALNDASHQFRTIEKRLLIRFKDGRPVQINHLSLLMLQTHHNLQRLASIIQHAQLE